MRKFTFLMVLGLLNFNLSAQIYKVFEGFEGSTISLTSSSSSGTNNWAVSTTLAKYGLKSDSCKVGLNDTTYLTSNTFSTLGKTVCFMEFDQICKTDAFDGGYIQVSNNNGVTWTTLTGNEYMGTGMFGTVGNKFFSGSYISTWQPASYYVIPTNTWWKHEKFNISALIPNTSQAKVRFVLVDQNGDGSAGAYGWFIDNIKVWIPMGQDATAKSLNLPNSLPSGCGLDNETLSITIFNSGSATINGNLTASYQKQGGSIVTETVPNIIPVNDSSVFYFSTKINLSSSSDTTFQVKAWLTLVYDSLHTNDTISKNLISRVAISSPVCSGVTIPYNTSTTLHANHLDSVAWFSDYLATNQIFSGKNFTTPILTDTTTYYIQAQHGIYNGDYIVGSGTITNTNSTYPAPYGNNYIGAKNQMLIRASELTAAGMYAGNIKSLAFDVVTVNGYPLTGFSIKLKLTTQNALTSTFITNLTTVYSTASYTEYAGWNTHLFQTPFYWDGTSNLVVETCFDNYPVAYTLNATVRQTTTSYISTTVYNEDIGSICVHASGSTFSQRPNMKFNAQATNPPCPSKVIPVKVNVTGIPKHNAGIINISSPSGVVSAGVSIPVEIGLKNYGSDTLKKVTIKYSVNDVLKSTYIWTGNLKYGSSISSINIGNEVFTSGVNTIKVWTSLPNDSLDANNTNDTATTYVFICMSGIYTLGDSTSDFKNFAELKMLLDSAGLCGPTIVKIKSGTYTNNLLLDSIKGINATNTLLLTSETSNPQDVVLQYGATSALSNYVVRFQKASYISLRKISIKAIGSTFCFGVEILDNSHHIIVDSCILISSAYIPTSARPISINQGNVNEFITIKNNTITGGYYGIYCGGGISTSNLARGNQIINNNIGSFYQFGIYANYQDSVQINGNYVHDILYNYDGYGIYSFYNYNKVSIAKNKLVLNPSGSSWAYGISMYYTNLNSATAAPSYCINNMVSVISGTNSNYGIYIQDATKIYVYNNSVSIESGGTNSKTLNQSGSTTGLLQYYKNNIWSNKGTGYCAYFTTPANVTYSDYNCYYAAGSKFAYYTAARANLAALQTASGKDAHSIQTNPQFTNSSDLHTVALTLDGKGSPDALVYDDFDGDIRHASTPDIGADEFYYILNDAGIIAKVSPGFVCAGISSSIQVSLKNFGINSITNCTINWSVNGVLQTPYASTITVASNTHATQTIGNYSFSANTNYILKFWTSNPNGLVDGNTMNDTLTIQQFKTALNNGTYTIGGASADFPTISDAVNTINNFGICGSIVFNINSGIYNETFSLNEISGSSPVNTIIFQSTNQDTASVHINFSAFSAANNYVARLNGADFVSFKYLSFTATGSTFGNVIALGKGANNNSIIHCQLITSAASNSNFAGIYDSTGNDYGNIFVGNRIVNGYYGIYLDGNLATDLQGKNVIDSNVFEGFSFNGISGRYLDSLSLKGNKMKGTQTLTYLRGIQLSNCKRMIEISENAIDLITNAEGDGIFMTSCDGLPSTSCLIANNSVSINCSNGSSYDLGIYQNSSTNLKIVFNSVNITNTSVNSIAMYSNQGSNIELLNNIWNIPNGKTLRVFTTYAITTCDYNNYYSNAAIFANWGSNVSDFSSLKALSGMDQHSLCVYPGFTSNSNLHIINSQISGAGLPLSYINRDIDGNPRDSLKPDIGADEFNPPLQDIALISMLTPTSGCSMDSIQIKVKAVNVGSDTIQGNLVLKYSKNNGQSYVSENVTSILAPNDTLTYTFLTKAYVQNISDSIYKFIVKASLFGDNFPYNDTIKRNVMNAISPIIPVQNNESTAYATSKTISLTNLDSIRWYSDYTLSNYINSGSNYTTPLLFDTTTYWITTTSTYGCVSNPASITVNVFGIPSGDVGIAAIRTNTGCGLDTNEIISIDVYNQGTSTINGVISASFKIDNQSWKPVEIINSSIPAKDTITYIFNAHANLKAMVNDTVFSIKAFVHLNADPYQGNDTLLRGNINSFIKPAGPIITSPVTILYGTQAVLTINSSNTVNWYDSLNSSTPVYTGNTFTTPYLFDTCTFYTDVQGQLNINMQIGSGNLHNSNTNYPAPYGNNYKGAKHQMLILASELQSIGITSGMLQSLAFHVDIANGAPLKNFTIKIGATGLNSLTSNFVGSLTTVYNNTSFSEINGWNNHSFQTPFFWNGIDNIIVETYFDNYPGSYTLNAVMTQTATNFPSSLVFSSDLGDVWTSTSGQIFNIRPNMKFGFSTQGCKSIRVPVVVNTTNPPAIDAGMATIISPLNNALPGVQTPIVVRIQNFGLTNLSSATISYRLGNQLKYVYNWSGNLSPGQVSSPITIYTDTFKGGIYSMKIWISNANGTTQGVNMNDTIDAHFTVCLSGSYSLGDIYSDFHTFDDAISSAKIAGVCGNVVFNIKPGIYNTQVKINNIIGLNASNTITFQSSTLDSNDVVLQYSSIDSAGNYVICLNSVKYIRLKYLSLKALGSTYGTVLVLDSGASENIVEHCVIEAPLGNSTFSNALYDKEGNDNNNVFRYNRFSNGNYTVYFSGASNSSRQKGILFENNLVENFYSAAIYCNYNDSFVFSNNLIISGSNSTATPTGVYLYYSGKNSKILNNQIVLNPLTSAIGLSFYVCEGIASNRLLVANNFVSINGGIGTSSGIYTYLSNYIDLYFNTVYSISGSVNDKNLYIQYGHDIRVMNNIFANKSGGITYSLTSNSIITISDYNDYYSSGPILASYGSNAANLTVLRSLTNQDLHSKSVDPGFIATNNVHIYNTDLNASGIPLSIVPYDIDGDIRNSSLPDIGADEFNISNLDIALTAINSPASSFASGTHNVHITIKNTGITTITTATIGWSVNGVLQTPYNYSGSLLSGTTADSILIGNFNFTVPYNAIKVWVYNPNNATDAYPYNDTLVKNSVSCTGLMAGNYSIGGATANFPTFNAAIFALNTCGIGSAVNFLVNPGIYNEQLLINPVAGASSLNKITFKAANGDSNSVVLTFFGVPMFNYTINLDGADYFTFKNLTIKATNPNYAKAIVIGNGANYNEFSNCIISSSGNSNSNSSCFFNENTNDNFNQIKNNKVLGGYYGIHFNSYAVSIFSNGNAISNNEISGFGSFAIIMSHQNSVQISFNKILSIVGSSATAIQLTNCFNGFKIEANKINLNATVTNYGLRLINGNYNDTISTRGLLVNNAISITNGGSNYGIFINNSQRTDLYFNTVHINKGTISYPLYLNNTSNQKGINIINNVFSNTSGYGVSVAVNEPVTIDISDYNNFYSTGPDLAIWAGAVPTNLWQLQGFSSKDSNSFNTVPMFVSNSDLHSNSPVLNSAGKPIIGIINDIDGEVRSSIAPDIGCDEFVPLNKDAMALSIIVPNDVFANVGQLFIPTFKIRNAGVDTLKAMTVGFKYGTTNQNVIWNGNLAPGLDTIFSFSQNIAVLTGQNLISYFTILTNDANTSNDTISMIFTGLSTVVPAYCDNFDQNPYLWAGEGDWEMGVPLGNTINSAYSSPNVWKTKLSGFYSLNDTSYLYSPFFDFSQIMGAILKFRINTKLAFNDVVNLQFSTNNGVNWSTLGYIGDTLTDSSYWYNSNLSGMHVWGGNSNGWKYASYRLKSFDYNSNPIQFRFVFISNNSVVDDGVAIDNFCIELPINAKDAGVLSIDQPSIAGTLSGSVGNLVKITIKNYGYDTLFKIPVHYQINSNTIINDTVVIQYPGLLLNQNFQFTFNDGFPGPGSNYSLCCWTDLPGDLYHGNDSICSTISVTSLALDVGIKRIITPGHTLNAFQKDSVKIVIVNYGTTALSSIPLQYKIGGANPISETWLGNALQPGDSVEFQFSTPFIAPSGIFQFCVKSLLLNDGNSLNDEICRNIATDIESSSESYFELFQNIPNPVQKSTFIPYSIPSEGIIHFQLVDIIGNQIIKKAIISQSGKNQMEINLDGISSGVYFYSLKYKDKILIKKLIVN